MLSLFTRISIALFLTSAWIANERRPSFQISSAVASNWTSATTRVQTVTLAPNLSKSYGARFPQPSLAVRANVLVVESKPICSFLLANKRHLVPYLGHLAFLSGNSGGQVYPLVQSDDSDIIGDLILKS
jgi:hypothetical protein